MQLNRMHGASMGRIADASPVLLHDVYRNHDGGDSGVKMTRLATGTLRRPPRGNKTRSGASSQEAARRFAARRLAGASRVASWNRLISRRPGELCKTQPR
jgi:hypothetical protein